MHLLDRVICNLQVKQEEYFPPNRDQYAKTDDIDNDNDNKYDPKADNSTNNPITDANGDKVPWDIQRQFNRLGLTSELWEQYYLAPIKVKDNSLLASILTIIDKDFVNLGWSEQVTRLEKGMLHLADKLTSESEREQFQYWADYFCVNILVWSADQITLIEPTTVHEDISNIDRSTMIFYQSATGQFRPMLHSDYRLHSLDCSDLLIGLLVQLDGKTNRN